MILHPAIVALLLSSYLVVFMVIYAAFFGVKILRAWDITSGSEKQLTLERSTYLISTFLASAFIFQIVSLFLFIYAADDLHTRFVGAMCAAGSLYVNDFGYPAFVVKIFSCILAGLWLILNHADSRAHDYPLIRKKYLLLLFIVPFILAEAVLQTIYFLKLRPDVITSCCGSLFSSGQESISGELAALPPGVMMITFYTVLILLAATGLRYYIRGRGARSFSFFSLIAFPVFAFSLISFISLYCYELPTHHCPFCILQNEYGNIGYLFYVTLLCGVVCGAGAGMLDRYKNIRSLSNIIPVVNRRLALFSISSYALFSVISIWKILTANLVLDVL